MREASFTKNAALTRSPEQRACVIGGKGKSGEVGNCWGRSHASVMSIGKTEPSNKVNVDQQQLLSFNFLVNCFNIHFRRIILIDCCRIKVLVQLYS